MLRTYLFSLPFPYFLRNAPVSRNNEIIRFDNWTSILGTAAVNRFPLIVVLTFSLDTPHKYSDEPFIYDLLPILYGENKNVLNSNYSSLFLDQDKGCIFLSTLLTALISHKHWTLFEKMCFFCLAQKYVSQQFDIYWFRSNSCTLTLIYCFTHRFVPSQIMSQTQFWN